MATLIRKILQKINIDHFIDLNLFKYGFRKNSFELKTNEAYSIYKNIIKPNSLVFDIGANQGNFTAAFLMLGAQVLSIEPQSKCFDFLKVRFKNNSNVTLLRCALDSKSGEQYIYISNSHVVSSMSEEWIKKVKESNRFPKTEWNKTETVATTTLDILIQKYGVPDYCKIDVEGFEHNVLKGLTKKIPFISIEYTYEHIENTKQCLSYLEKIGNLQILLLEEIMDFSIENKWCTANEIINKLESFNDTGISGDLLIKIE